MDGFAIPGAKLTEYFLSDMPVAGRERASGGRTGHRARPPPYGRASSSERSLLMHRAFTRPHVRPHVARGFLSLGGVGFVAMWVAMSGGCGSGPSGTGQAGATVR